MSSERTSICCNVCMYRSYGASWLPNLLRSSWQSKCRDRQSLARSSITDRPPSLWLQALEQSLLVIHFPYDKDLDSPQDLPLYRGPDFGCTWSPLVPFIHSFNLKFMPLSFVRRKTFPGSSPAIESIFFQTFRLL